MSLPTLQEVIERILSLQSRTPGDLFEIADVVAEEIISIWTAHQLPTKSLRSIKDKLVKSFKTYQKVIKYIKLQRPRVFEKRKAFVEKLDRLFNIVGVIRDLDDDTLEFFFGCLRQNYRGSTVVERIPPKPIDPQTFEILPMPAEPDAPGPSSSGRIISPSTLRMQARESAEKRKSASEVAVEAKKSKAQKRKQQLDILHQSNRKSQPSLEESDQEMAESEVSFADQINQRIAKRNSVVRSKAMQNVSAATKAHTDSQLANARQTLTRSRGTIQPERTEVVRNLAAVDNGRKGGLARAAKKAKKKEIKKLKAAAAIEARNKIQQSIDPPEDSSSSHMMEDCSLQDDVMEDLPVQDSPFQGHVIEDSSADPNLMQPTTSELAAQQNRSSSGRFCSNRTTFIRKRSSTGVFLSHAPTQSKFN